MATKKLQIIDSLVKQAENANTLDGKSAEEFALTSDVEKIQLQIGDKSVADQISSAVSTLSETSVPVDRTIAGIDLQDDITADELRRAIESQRVIINSAVPPAGGKKDYAEMGDFYFKKLSLDPKLYLCIGKGVNTESIDGEYDACFYDWLDITNDVTHSWDGTTLTITSASGTSSADLKGEKGAEGVGIEKMEQVKQSAKDGEINIFQFTLTDGTVADYLVYNGSKGSQGEKGEDGYTPVKGVDYWTEEDKTEINAESQNFISTELAKRNQLTPEFANSIDECIDTSKLYVLPDGYIYAYMSQNTISYTNMLTRAIGTDGAPFQNGKGYAENSRMGSSGIYVGNVSGVDCTGFIEIDPSVDQIIRFKNVTMRTDSPNANNVAIAVWNDSFARLNFMNIANFVSNEKYNLVLDGTNIVQITFPIEDISIGTKYIAICCDDINDNSVITINEEIKDSEATYNWANTGHSFVPADYEDKIIALDEEINSLESVVDDLSATSESHTSQLAEIDKKLSNMGSETTNIPAYWQTHLDTRVDNIHEVMEEAGRNKSAFLFYSDAHWTSSTKNAPMLLNYLTTNTAINKTIFGGDIVDDEPTTETLSNRSIMKYLWDWRSQVRNLKHYSVVGNHDDGNATNNIFSYDYVYSFLFAPEENNDIVRDADTYYYFDDKREKTRYLCLDTAYESAYTLSTAQATFIKQTLKDTPENWHIIVVAHIWYGPDYDQYSVRPIPIAGLSGTATQVITILDNYNSRTDEFADCKAKVEFCIGGHVHRDYVDKTTSGIPIVLCETASSHIRSEFSHEAGTITETAVSAIVADYNSNKLSVIRVGRGNSFEVDLATGNSSTIPDEPSELVYTNVLETVGYTNGYRISASNGNESVSANHSMTGFIPCKAGDTIYMKNVNMPDVADYDACVGYYDSDQSYIIALFYNSSMDNSNLASTLTYDENGHLTKFKLSSDYSDLSYIRICCLGIDETSIITVNEPIE